FFFFFFSSRRRHTRSYGDWSSDVCSSDLISPPPLAATTPSSTTRRPSGRTTRGRCVPNGSSIRCSSPITAFRCITAGLARSTTRSEERRVGKEGKWGGGGEWYKDKGKE